MTLKDCLRNNNWDFSCSSFDIPSNIKMTIENTYLQESNSKPDPFLWNRSNDGYFNTQSDYLSFLKANYETFVNTKCNYTLIWKINAINKIFFKWLLIIQKLPTSLALYSRNTSRFKKNCATCHNMEEHTNHIFINYPDAEHIWENNSISFASQDLHINNHQLCIPKGYIIMKITIVCQPLF